MPSLQQTNLQEETEPSFLAAEDFPAEDPNPRSAIYPESFNSELNHEVLFTLAGKHGSSGCQFWSNFQFYSAKKLL